MEKFYLAVTVGDNKKYYAYIIPVTSMDNILCKTPHRCIHANIYRTKKRAEEIVRSWNEAYWTNGTYMFAEPF